LSKKRPHATVTITAKLPLELAEEFYKVVNSDYEGNSSAAQRAAIKYLVDHREEVIAYAKANP
jgi:metal-responsive CopG/Arc/MetJ family transcriptional regulator